MGFVHFTQLTGKGSGPSCMTKPSMTWVKMWGLTIAFCFSTTDGVSCFPISGFSSATSIFSGAGNLAKAFAEGFSCFNI